MSAARWKRLALVAPLACLLVACGGGSGPTTGVGIGGTGKPGVTFGDVHVAAGGVTVARTTFETDGALVRIGGKAATAADLRTGHVALVEGTIAGATGVAARITVDEVIRGTLQARPGANTLTVQGQIVEFDERTAFGAGIEPSSADGLSLGDVLEIWGYLRGPGRVRATRIEREDNLDDVRLIGIAAEVDGERDTFRIGTQQIDHRNADLGKLPSGDPVVDQVVRVRGHVAGSGVLEALEVEPRDFDDAPDNDETEIEGFVTAVLPGVGFRVGTVEVRVSGATVFVGGEAQDVVVGTELDVKGSLAAGVVTARVVEFEANVRIEADIASIAGDLIACKGLPGLVVRVDALTDIDGDAKSLADLVSGDHIRVRARVAGASTVVAEEIVETSADTTLEFLGPVDASPVPSSPVFHMLGVAIDTASIRDGDFESPSGAALDRAGFFAFLTPGRLVAVKGDLSGGEAVWDQADLKDGD